MKQPPPPLPGTRVAELVRGFGALAVLVILLAGVPAGLLTVAGPPLPRTLPAWDQITATLTQPDTGNTLFLAVIKVIGWTAWFLFTLITLTEATGYRRGRPPQRLPGAIRPMQHLARDLIATTALIMTTTPALGAAGPAAGALTHPVTATTPLPTPLSTAATATPSAEQRPTRLATAPGRRWRTRTIRRGDTLWAIARQTTGSGAHYPTIFDASRHLTQPHDLPPLTDPDRIYPGQRIQVPAHQTPASHPRHRAQPPQRPSSGPPAAASSTPRPSPITTAPPSAVSPPAATTTPQPASPVPAPPARTAPATPSTHGPGTVPHPPPVSRPATPSPSATAPATPTPTPTPSADIPPPRTVRPPGQDHQPPGTVTLPTGTYLSLGLATAISIALAATRLHRRRRRSTTTWPAPTEPATPTAVAAVRKAHLDACTAHGTPPPTDADLLANDATEPAPTHITAGTRGKDAINLKLSGLSLGLTGPGATAVARAWLTEILAKSSRNRTELLIPQPDATTLLTGTGIDITELAIPGLVITASLQAAITHLEAEFVCRARLMATHDQPDIHALRATEPGEPLPVIIVLTAAPASSDALEAILALSAPYDIGALILGTWTAGTTLHLTADGTVTHATGPAADTWTDCGLFHLGLAETAEMLQVIRTASGAPERPPAEPPTSTPTPRTPSKTQTPPPVRAAGSAADATTNPPDPGPPAGAEDHDATRPVRLSILGPIHLTTTNGPLTTGLRRITRELLAYLALHPDGITREQGVDALMPNRDLETGTTMFHTAIGNARKTLRHATGLRSAMFITHTDGRYRLDPHLIQVDLWNLHTALDHAHHAETDTTRINALRRIPDLYTAELTEDLTHEWAETERENLRRHATDALSQLAHLTKQTHPDHAITALQTAITHDPYAEPLYQDLMRLHAQTSRPDAIQRTYDQLKNHLADLDTEPDEQTHQLLLTLLHPPSDHQTQRQAPSPTSQPPDLLTVPRA